MSLRSLFGILLACLALTAQAAEIREWPVPWENTRPRDPSVAPDGRIWFVGQAGNYLAVFDPDSEQFERYELPPKTRPHSVLVDHQGQIWVAGNGNGTLLRFDDAGLLQQTIEVPVPEGARVADPHTIALDGHGGLWFTLQMANAIAHLDPASGEIRMTPMATPQSRPYGIIATAEGDAWAVLFGAAKLVRVGLQDGQIREVELPDPASRPRRLGIDHDGVIWYGDFSQSKLGRYDPHSNEVIEWPLPSTPSLPYAMAIDANGDPWLFETAPQPNLLQRFDPRRARFGMGIEVPGGGGVVRHAVYDPVTDSIWFGTDRNTLGRAQLD